MGKKILTIILILVVVSGLFGVWFLITNKPVPFIENLTSSDGSGFLGFGGLFQKKTPSDVTPEKPITIGDETPSENNTAEAPRLERLTANAVSGATFAYVERPIKAEEATIPFEPIDFTGYPILRPGDENDSVANLQTVLAYKNGLGDEFITGIFDEDTKNAIIAFQVESNLKGDAVVGKKTYDALNAFQGLIEKPTTEIVPVVRYVEKKSGNIFDIDLDTLVATQKTNTIILRTHESFFLNDAQTAILRYAKDNETVIATFVGSIVPSAVETAPGKLTGTFFPENIPFLSSSPDKKSIFYLTPNTNGIAGVVSNIENTSRRTIFDSPFTEWIPDWTNKDTITLQTKASAKTDGFIYGLSVKTGTFWKILGDKKGLTGTMNPDGTLVVYSESKGGKPALSLYTIATGKSIDLGTQTLSEKCVWDTVSVRELYCAVPNSMKSGDYPDVWYQGRATFSDEIWKLDGESGVYSQVVDPESMNASLDIINMVIEKDGKYIIFTDKKTGQLWMYRL